MNRTLLSVVAIVAVVAIAFGFYFNNGKKELKSNQAEVQSSYIKELKLTTVLPKPRTIAPFSLSDNNNRAFTNKDLLGHWSMLFFGFTHCHYICPTSMAELRDAYTLLKDKKIKLPKVVFISVDPERDSIERLNTFIYGFNPLFMGARGDQDAIKNLTGDLKVLYVKEKPKDGSTNYTIAHSSSILLVNPDGKFVALISMPHTAKQIAHDYALVIANED